MMMVYFKTRRDKDDMIRKSREMERLSAEFADCLERCEEDESSSEYEERPYRVTKSKSSRYSY